MSTVRIRTVVPAVVILCTLLRSQSAHSDTFGNGDNTFEIEFVAIGDPGNNADTTGNPIPAGSVSYVYRMGKFEVSRDMVTKANAEGNLGLTLYPMDFVTGGLRPDMPATGVSWNEVARFANWLNTSQGFPAAYKFSTQPGKAGYEASENIDLWQAGDEGFDPANPFRNSQARYFLPSAHEWYKAAYYDPNANSGAGGYWDYPTVSDAPPTRVANGTAAGTAVYGQRVNQGPADITLAGGLSPYGVMALGGNVWEWEETEGDLTNDSGSSFRGVRGGDWDFPSNKLSASSRDVIDPTEADGRHGFGFRVASIPGPSVGDFDMNGLLDIEDINLLTAASATGENPAEFNLNTDALVNVTDVTIWVRDFFVTWIGDANLDKEFNSGDMVSVLQAGLYYSGDPAVWETGDWNGDGLFDSSDIVSAFVVGGYEKGLRTNAVAVPEPGGWVLLALATIFLLSSRRNMQLRERATRTTID